MKMKQSAKDVLSAILVAAVLVCGLLQTTAGFWINIFASFVMLLYLFVIGIIPLVVSISTIYLVTKFGLRLLFEGAPIERVRLIYRKTLTICVWLVVIFSFAEVVFNSVVRETAIQPMRNNYCECTTFECRATELHKRDQLMQEYGISRIGGWDTADCHDDFRPWYIYTVKSFGRLRSQAYLLQPE